MAGSSWQVWLSGSSVGHREGRQAAMNVIDRPYQKGLGKVVHLATGETWERRGGSWTQTQWPARKRAGLAKQGVPA